MGTAVQSGTGDVPAATALRGGVVCRRALFGRLERAGRVAQVTAPAGSGKTVPLRSWIGEACLADSAAWVSVEPGEHDLQRFRVSLADGLRGTIAGSKLVRPLTAAPDLNGWAVVKRLLEDLGSLQDRPVHSGPDGVLDAVAAPSAGHADVCQLLEHGAELTQRPVS